MKIKDLFSERYVWILLLILLATIFMFRFKYIVTGRRLIRVNRITGEAKLYEYDRDSGKYVHDVWKQAPKVHFRPRRLETEE